MGPFDPEPETNMAFESQALLTSVDAAILAIRSNTSLIVVAGEAGVGKTFFYRWFTEGLTRDVLLLRYAEPPASSDAFLDRLTRELEIARNAPTASVPAGRPEVLVRCRELLQRLAADDTAALLVMDDAHRLPVDALDDLCELLTVGRDANHLQVVLIGRPELKALLDRPGVRGLAPYEVKRLQLRPLRRDEVGPYIVRRLTAARSDAAVRPADASEADQNTSGGAGALLRHACFTAAATHRLALLSEGRPGVLNLLCDRALRFGHAHRTWRIGRREVLAAARDLRLPVSLGVRFAGVSRNVARWRIHLSRPGTPDA